MALLLPSLLSAVAADQLPPIAPPASPPCLGSWCASSPSATWALGLGVPAAFLLAAANGANDIANSVGTAVGARVLSMRQALVAGCLFEFIGAMAIGPFVASSIAGNEVQTAAFDDDPALFSILMLSSLLGAGSTTLLATLYGYPISATHGIISGIITVALCTGKPDVLDVHGVTLTIIGCATR